MNFLKAKLIFSKTLTNEIKQELIEVINKANEITFPKQDKINPAKVSISLFEDSALVIEINSNGFVRPHSALLQLRKLISEAIGKKFKLGVKKIEGVQYLLELDYSGKSFNLKLPFIESIDFNEGKAIIKIGKTDQHFLERNFADRIINLFNEKIEVIASGKKELTKLVKQSEKRINKYVLKEDPTEQLIKLAWVKRSGAGVWTILPQYTALLRAIESLVVQEIAKPLGFQEVIFPRLINLNIQRKKGQLSGIPNEMFFVCPPISRNPEAWEEYTNLVKVTQENHPEKLKEFLGNPSYALAYAQCEPFYDFFEGKIMDLDQTPLKFFEKNGDTYRYESGGLKGLERLNEFNRIEFTYLGSKEKMIKIRDAILEKALKIVDELFDLEWKLESATPVYLVHAGKVDEEVEENFVKTYDISVKLPFETPSRPEKELEISSFHIHKSFYADQFHWKEKLGRVIWSGCTGIAPTRWAYVFLLRFGLDYNNWPDKIKQLIGKQLPSLPEKLFMK